MKIFQIEVSSTRFRAFMDGQLIADSASSNDLLKFLNLIVADCSDGRARVTYENLRDHA